VDLFEIAWLHRQIFDGSLSAKRLLNLRKQSMNSHRMVVADVRQQRMFLFTELANLLFVGINAMDRCSELGEAGATH